MTTGSLKERLAEDTKATMRARDSRRLGVMRLIASEIKRIEVDERRELDDTAVLAVLEKMLKQRTESERQYRDAGRADLADQEAFEIALVREYMPQPLDEAELASLIDSTVAETCASSARDMGAVMNALRPKLLGRADMKQVSALVKARLG